MSVLGISGTIIVYEISDVQFSKVILTGKTLTVVTTTADQPDINHLTAVTLATVHNFQLALLIIYI